MSRVVGAIMLSRSPRGLQGENREPHGAGSVTQPPVVARELDRLALFAEELKARLCMLRALDNHVL
jgi:hypothetical protein